MPIEPKWLQVETVRAIHQRQTAEHGGDPATRDAGALESALARPINLWAYSEPKPGLAELAASYAFGIAKNHPFVDGNKRTSYVACRTFLLLNGGDFQADPAESYATWIDLAQSEISETELAAWVRARMTSTE